MAEKKLIITPDEYRGGIFDTESQERQALGDYYEQKEAEAMAMFYRQMNEVREVIVNQYDNVEHQQGRRMVSQVVEGRIRDLVPAIHFMTKALEPSQCDFLGLPQGSCMKSMDLVLPNGEHEPLCGFQNQPIMPEYTILLRRKVKTPNFGVHNVDSSEFPKSRWDDEKKAWVFDSATPFEIETTEPAGTLVGWRTLLARIVMKRLATPQEVESKFGISDRKSWAVRMGRSNEPLIAI